MLNIAADHINAVEAKEASFRTTELAHTERVRMIGVLQRTIADAERRKVAPIAGAMVVCAARRYSAGREPDANIPST